VSSQHSHQSNKTPGELQDHVAELPSKERDSANATAVHPMSRKAILIDPM
jgi:hypothetical protein